jgi:polysaccharide biosynthesis transport protein
MQIRADLKNVNLTSRLYPPPSELASPELPRAAETKDLSEVVNLLLRRLGIVLSSVLVGAVLAAFFVYETSPRYAAKALLVVGDGQDSAESIDMSLDTQIAMLTSQGVLESVLQSLWQGPRFRKEIPSLADLERHLKIMQELRSRMIGVTFIAKSPGVAAEVANRVANLYVQRVEEGSPALEQDLSLTSEQIAALNEEIRRAQAALARTVKDEGPNAPFAVAIRKQINDLEQAVVSMRLRRNLTELREEDRRQREIMSPLVRVYALATPPQIPSSISPILIFVPAILASTIFGVILAIFLGRLDRRVYKRVDLSPIGGVHCVGSVPGFHRELEPLRIPACGTEAARALESLVASLLVLPARSPGVILFTSCRKNQGSINFSLIFAHAAARVKHRVLFIDLDVTHRDNSALLSGHPGILDVLAGQSASDIIQHATDLRVDLLPIGNGGQDSLTLLSGPRFPAELDRMRTIYDCVVINGPPVLDSAEAMILAQMADQTVLVTKAHATEQEDVENAVTVVFNAIGLAARPSGLATVLLAAGGGTVEGVVVHTKNDPSRRRRRSADANKATASPPGGEVVPDGGAKRATVDKAQTPEQARRDADGTNLEIQKQAQYDTHGGTIQRLG